MLRSMVGRRYFFYVVFKYLVIEFCVFGIWEYIFKCGKWLDYLRGGIVRIKLYYLFFEVIFVFVCFIIVFLGLGKEFIY